MYPYPWHGFRVTWAVTRHIGDGKSLPAHRYPRPHPLIHNILQPSKTSVHTCFRGFPSLFTNDDKWQRQQQLQLQLPMAMDNEDDGNGWEWAYKGTPRILYLLVLLLTTNRTSTTTRRVRPLLVRLVFTRRQRGGFTPPRPFLFNLATTRRAHPLLIH